MPSNAMIAAAMVAKRVNTRVGFPPVIRKDAGASMLNAEIQFRPITWLFTVQMNVP